MKTKQGTIIGVLVIVCLLLWWGLFRQSGQATLKAEAAQIVAPAKPAGHGWAGDGNPGGTSAMRSLRAGGREWEIAFADPTLSEKERAIIIADLNLIFGHLPEAIIDRLDSPIQKTIGAQTITFDRRVRFEGAARKSPAIFHEDPFGCLIQGDPADRFFVSQPVIDAYRAAIGRKDQNADAYAQLAGFLGALNQLREKPIQNAKNLFLVADNQRNTQAGIAAIKDEDFASAWSRARYRDPSILNIEQTAGTDLEPYGELVATTYAITNGQFNDLFPIVYHQGQWRMVASPPGT